MIYLLKKEDREFEIDDTVFFDQQPKAFRDIFTTIGQGSTAEFDNAQVTLLETGRVIVTMKKSE